MNMKKEYQIYKISNTINDKLYIGMTSNPYLCGRLGSHRCSSRVPKRRRVNKFWNALYQLGDMNFKIELLEKTDSLEKAERLEEFYIKKYNSVENGYNTYYSRTTDYTWKRRAVRCITTGEVFDFIKKACAKYDVAQASISNNCMGKRYSAGKLNGEKLVWEYVV